jgi:hypothetical protein
MCHNYKTAFFKAKTSKKYSFHQFRRNIQTRVSKEITIYGTNRPKVPLRKQITCSFNFHFSSSTTPTVQKFLAKKESLKRNPNPALPNPNLICLNMRKISKDTKYICGECDTEMKTTELGVNILRSTKKLNEWRVQHKTARLCHQHRKVICIRKRSYRQQLTPVVTLQTLQLLTITVYGLLIRSPYTRKI